jgi:hypothetical protein
MRTFVLGVTLGLVLAGASQAAAQVISTERTLRLSFNADGTVNLAARNVTVREILAEWARQCQCVVVNAERMPGGALMLPLQFEQASQSTVLATLLRQAAGYVLTPQRAGARSASRYETIYILATSATVASAYVPPPAATGPPPPTTGVPDSELPPVVPIPMQPTGAMQQAPPPAPGSSTFPARTNSSFMGTGRLPTSAAAPGFPTPGSAMPGTATVPPGTVTPVPQAGPGTPGMPLPPGTVVPIVSVPPSR